MSEIQKYEQPSLAVRDQVNQIQALMKNALQGWSYDTVVTQRDLDGGHREYTVTVKLIDRKTGQLMGTGIGLCTTMESKYRYRRDKRTNKRSENPDIADVYSTVLKMAKKRAFVDAVKSTAAASDIFTQDIEDMVVVQSVYEVPEQQPEHQKRDPRLDPIRERMKPFMKKLGYDASQATACILDYAGRGSMDQLTDEDIETAVEYMDGIIETDAMYGVQG